MKNHTDDAPRYWSSIAEYHAPDKAPTAEFDQLASEDDLTLDGVSRRKFMAISAAGAALAGTTGACIRKPVEKIVPYAIRPEDHIPGKATFYASTFTAGTKVLGVVVESQDGRPIKVEGNPQHPNSRGKSGMWAQASILNIYDPERSDKPALVLHTSDQAAGGKKSRQGGHIWTDVSMERAWGVVDSATAAARSKRGQGLALVVPTVVSPSIRAWLRAIQRAMPQARLFRADPAYPANTRAGAALVGGAGTHVTIDPAQAQVILSIDSDFLGREGDSERHAAGFAARRRVERQTDPMNRLYAIDPHMTVTGANADHRLRLRARDTGTALKQIAATLFGRLGVAAPRGSQAAIAELSKVSFSKETAPAVVAFIDSVAKDLAANRGKALIVVGERQPAWVHALGHLVNEALGSVGRTIRWHQERELPDLGSVQDLAKGLNENRFTTVVTLGANPIHTAPGELGLRDAYKKAKTTIHFGFRFDETAQLSNVHIPLAHWLEAWGDAKSEDGTVSLQQPLIAPLMHAPSTLEAVARIANGTAVPGRTLLMQHWQKSDGDKEWQQWLHSGVIGVQDTRVRSRNWAQLGPAISAAIAPALLQGFEINFHWDSKLLDGRWANNGWLVELPDPISKLAWDNAAYLSPDTAAELELQDGDMVEIAVAGRKVRMPAMVSPGQTNLTVSVNLGWGRDVGSVAQGAGVNVYPLQDAAGSYFLANATLKKVGGTSKLANVQKYGSLTPPANMMDWKRRPIIRVADRGTVDGKTGWVRYVPPEKRQPAEPAGKDTTAPPAPTKKLRVLDENFVNRDELLPPNKIKSLSDNPLDKVKAGVPNPHNLNCDDEYYAKYGAKGACEPPQQWGMSIDLNTCIGCGACLVACVAENNVPVVGKDRVLKGREMHWIRLDRYYEGDPNDPWVSVMPMPCQQCENAPCETVCPVAATVHSPEGLNDMAYNRCIGTRYCANNCPYKVRRFNYFNYNLDIHPLQQMQKNPDVTIRFRGVMEKCTYCVQRINEAKIDAKVNGNRRVPDIDDRNGKSMPVISACQQACPTDAIVMGDISDPNSRVAKLKAQPRSYAVLSYLNTWPRTTYLAKIRNPNPDLV